MAHISRTRMALLVVLLSCLVACSNATDSEAEGAAPSSEELAAQIASIGEVSANFDQVRSILVARGGELVHEQYFNGDADSYFDVQSVTKSVVSTLIGIAIGDGVIGGVDDTLAQLLPEDVDAMSAEVQATTLRQLLTMDAGLGMPESGAVSSGATRSKDWVRDILANPKSPPGQGFEYSNATSHLLAAIVAHATGITPLEYAREHLFGPLGIDSTPAWTEEIRRGNLDAYEKADFAWPTDPQGINIGFGAIKLRPRDMVKLGSSSLTAEVGRASRSSRRSGSTRQPRSKSKPARTSTTAISGGPGIWTATGRSKQWGTAARRSSSYQAATSWWPPRASCGRTMRLATASTTASSRRSSRMVWSRISHPRTDPIAER